MRNAEPSRDRRRVALVPVEELDDGLGLAECPDPLVDPRHVDRVEDEHRPADPQRMRGSREETGLGPAEAALEPVTELEAQPPMNVSYRRNTFRLMMTPAIAQAATFVSLVFTSEPMRSRRLVKMTSGTSAKEKPEASRATPKRAAAPPPSSVSKLA